MLLFKGSPLLTVALFFLFSFLPLVAVATPPPLNLPSANWLIHRQGVHVPIVAGGHRAMAKRICFGDCREIKVDGVTGESAGSKLSSSPLPASVPDSASSTEGLLDPSSSVSEVTSSSSPSSASASSPTSISVSSSITLEGQATTPISAATTSRIVSIPLVLTAMAGVAVFLVML
ncbi:hypothetical protein EWM64_g8093 [Hericium alpestre]|uniref:Uncharacterized protein n=1 Tax=Hericium alpestre TaxID=135208 RepID=A0A4Y9ZR18_9AGAM|nr:hypothetical protein EWM64_g8093 [Hericium alpestre]